MSVTLHHPMNFIRAFLHTLDIGTIVFRYREIVGVFGWLTVLIEPRAVYLLPLANFVIVWSLGLRGTLKRSIGHAFWCLALAAASTVLIFAAAYLLWTQAGQETITSVQGRYFIPILALAGVAAVELAPSSRSSPRRWLSWASIVGIVVIQIVAMDTTIVRAFDVF